MEDAYTKCVNLLNTEFLHPFIHVKQSHQQEMNIKIVEFLQKQELNSTQDNFPNEFD